jgi:hypothetical protein
LRIIKEKSKQVWRNRKAMQEKQNAVSKSTPGSQGEGDKATTTR